MNKPDNNKIVALYTRVSTGYQVDKDSLPFQRKELTEYAEHILKTTNYEVFEDAGKSGKNTDRPAYQRMMKRIREGKVSHVLVYKIDRISRNLVDFSLMYDELKEYRVTFISLREQFDTSSAVGETVLKIILVFAELERKMTSERVTAIMIERANAKKWNGARMPFGWKWNEEAQFPEHDPVEGPYAVKMYEVYDETKSTAKVRDYLYDHSISTKRGGRWTTTTILNFLRNPMNKGDYRYNYRNSARGKKKPEGEVVYVPNAFPPLVPRELWDRVNRQIDDNAKRTHLAGFSHKTAKVHVFGGGLMVCDKCGMNFQISSLDRPRKNGYRPTIYVCTNRRTYRACDAAGTSDVIVGPFVFNFVANLVRAVRIRKDIDSPAALARVLLSGPEFDSVSCIHSDDLQVLYSAVRSSGSGRRSSYIPDPVSSGPSDPAGVLEGKKAEEAKLSRALDRLKRAYLFDDDAIPEAEYLSTRADLTEKIAKIRNEIAAYQDSTADSKTEELSFLKSASAFLVSYRIQSGQHINYPELAAAADPKTLYNFVHVILQRIIIKNRVPSELLFKNGLRVRFLYGSDAAGSGPSAADPADTGALLSAT